MKSFHRILEGVFKLILLYSSKKRKKNNLGDEYEPTVSVSTKPPSGGPEMSHYKPVKDNSIGIPPKETVDKIFQYTFYNKTNRAETGLGLWLSYDIIKTQVV